jgi:anti-sigma-K factor RskA
VTNHEQVLDLIPAYVLGALSPAEADQVDEHLGQCEFCQVELRAYQQVVEELPLAARQHAPPAAVKQRLMTRVKQQAPVRPSLVDRSRRLIPAWSLVSLALILVLAVSNLWLWQRVTELDKADEFHVVAMVGTDYTPESSGMLVISPDGLEGTLIVENLPALEPETQYQLWLIREGERDSGGVFSVSKSGYGHLRIMAPASLLSFDAFGITIEPEGGSPGPTGEKVLGGDL